MIVTSSQKQIAEKLRLKPLEIEARKDISYKIPADSRMQKIRCQCQCYQIQDDPKRLGY